MRRRSRESLAAAACILVAGTTGLLAGASFEPKAGERVAPSLRTPAAVAIDDAGDILVASARHETGQNEARNREIAQALRVQLSRERTRHRMELRAARRDARRWRRAAKASPSVDEALTLASIVYGVDRGALSRVAWCESRHDPSETNGQYRGLFQWGPAWSSTSYAALSPFSPYAAALATAQRVSAAGWGWWECKP